MALSANGGPRQAAIAAHMGAPKVTGGHQQPSSGAKRPPMGQRFLNKGSGKMETRGQMKAYHKGTLEGKHGKPSAPPGKKGGGGGGKPAGAPPGAPLGSMQKGIGELNQGDIVNRARTEARLARNQELVPLQAQAKEIGANEQGVQQRYGQLVGAANTQAQHLQEGQAASAKTFENQAAENALTAGKAIETTGQTQATMTGGYTSPELRAQMALSSQQAAGAGGAGSAFAQSVAAAGASNIAQMRGAASLNALGGSQNITNVFQKQLAQNQIAQQGVNAKTGLREIEGRSKLEQANFADKLAQGKLESEGAYKAGQLKIGAQNAGTAARNAGTAAAAQKSTAEYHALMGKLGIAKLEGDERQRAINNRINSGKLRVSELSQQDKAAYDKWKQSQPGSVALSASAIKFVDGVAKAESYARAHVKHPKHGHEEVEKVRSELRGKNISADEISAALNKLVYGRVGPGDAKRAKALGITKQTNPSWFG